MSYIDDELAIEGLQRIKYINLIFSFSKDIEKLRVITRKKPLLFRNSKKYLKAGHRKMDFWSYS
jgi:ABC-2 type transport system permease protein